MTHKEEFDKDGLINFGQAMLMLLKGHTISRFTLNYPFYFKIDSFVEADKVFQIPMTFHKHKELKAPAVFADSDITAEDWIIYVPNQKL